MIFSVNTCHFLMKCYTNGLDNDTIICSTTDLQHTCRSWSVRSSACFNNFPVTWWVNTAIQHSTWTVNGLSHTVYNIIQPAMIVAIILVCASKRADAPRARAINNLDYLCSMKGWSLGGEPRWDSFGTKEWSVGGHLLSQYCVLRCALKVKHLKIKSKLWLRKWNESKTRIWIHLML